jgi:hypothetical protein
MTDDARIANYGIQDSIRDSNDPPRRDDRKHIGRVDEV